EHERVRFIVNIHIENGQLRPQLYYRDRAIFIGIGNLLLDCARMLLTTIDYLAKIDITNILLDRFRQTRIGHIILVDRRRPIQLSFTIKEFHQLNK
ncbi:unnamed protein product, partial [Rotaria sordida]